MTLEEQLAFNNKKNQIKMEMTPEQENTLLRQENTLLRQKIEELEEQITDLKSELGSAGIFI